MRKYNIITIVILCFLFVSQIANSQSKNKNPGTFVDSLGTNFLTEKGGIGLSIGIFKNLAIGYRADDKKAH
ncbi:MAG TPA: hypothetical protein VJ954_04755 [Ignavibacteriaceae bacterium]|nr:hypothetical protein [Ignavibacteriaceae bacterium]